MKNRRAALKAHSFFNTSVFPAEVLFLLFLLLKPLYLFPSGHIGIADICLVTAGIYLLALELVKYFQLKRSGERPQFLNMLFYTKDYSWYLFLGCALLVNLFWCIRTGNREFLKYSVFWCYNGMAIWVFRRMDTRKRGLGFRYRASVILLADLIIQLAVILLGKGRTLVETWGGIRQMGTFNDPNQLSFFVFAAAMLVYLYAVRVFGRNRKLSHRSLIMAVSAYLAAFLIIILAKSTGMLMGMLLFAVFFWVLCLRELIKTGIVPRKAVFGFAAAAVVLGGMLLLMIWPSPDFDIEKENYNIVTRIQEKLWLLSYGGIESSYLSRGFGVVLQYPRYLILGAGEGFVERFSASGFTNEIHSGPVNLLFCYGIIPSLLMVFWFFRSIVNKRLWELPAVFAVLIESFLLINYRQPMFWYIFL